MRKEVKPTPSGMAVLTVRMPASMIGELRREAAARGISVSELVREAVVWKRSLMLPPSIGTSWMINQPNPGNYFFTTGQRLL